MQSKESKQDMQKEQLTTPGKIALNASAAASDLGRPLFRLSLYVKRD